MFNIHLSDICLGDALLLLGSLAFWITISVADREASYRILERDQ